MKDKQRNEWVTTILELRATAKVTSDPVLLDRARINMLDMVAIIDDLRRQVADLETLLRREEARG